MPAFTIGTHDLGSDNRLNLLAAINAQNGTNYTLAEYDFTEPTRVTIPTPTFNTKIKLGPLAATGKIGFKTIYYNRIHVSDIGILTITYQNEMFLTELLGRLSEKYGIPLSSSDVYEQRIIPPVFPETEVSLTLNFRESSIAYYGGGAIVLGSNDPDTEFDSPLTMPFKNDLVFYVNNYIRTNTGNNYLESSILAIASDKIRSRTMTVTEDDASTYAALLKNTYTDANRAKLNQFLPFVFTWAVGETKIIRGVNIYGDVIEINETSNSITKIGNLYTFNPLLSSDLLNARNKILVREGTRARDGKIYLLVGNPLTSQVNLLRSVDEGLNFAVVTVNRTNRAAFNYSLWENVIIHDMIVANGKLYVLVTNPVTYGTNPGKSSSGPAVEEFDLVNGSSNYFPLLNQGSVINASLGLVFSLHSKLRFVSSENETPNIDVVGFARTALTLEPVVAYFHRPTNLEYIPEIVNIKILDYPYYGISAYSKPLVKDPLGSFVSIEILTMVPSSVKDNLFLIENNARTETSHLGYGVITASCIRKGIQRGDWNENVLDLGGGSRPMTVTVVDNGKRNHYIFSGGNGIFRTEYSESAPNTFVPMLEKVFDVGDHAGFSLECDIGNGSYLSPNIQENDAMAAVFNNYPNEEIVKPLIGFSFIAKNKVTSEDMWLTSPDAFTALTERVFGREYSFLGSTPLAVFTDATGKTFAWTKYQGIYVSSDQGRSWSDYSSAKSYYSNTKYLGRATIPLKSEDFKALSTSTTITYAEIHIERSLAVFDIATSDSNFALNINDKVVYRINGDKPAGDFILNTPYLTTSLNGTSYFSPRQLVGWDTDATNNIKALSQYTENGVTDRLNQFDIPSALADTAIDVYSDVGFLGLKAVVLTYSAVAGVGYRLHTVSDTDVVVNVGLKNSTAPTFTTFEPIAIQPLWDGNHVGLGYTPIIITSTSKDILILERDGLGGSAMTINSISLVIPGDTGKPLQWFGMFSSNRRDRFVFQENNGIFKLVYSYNGVTFKSVITLTKLFDTSSLNVETVYSGCQYNLPNIVPFSNLAISAWPALDTVLGNDCLGFNRREKLADGFGSYYWRITQVNSTLCGYVEPTPGAVDPDAPTQNFNDTFSYNVLEGFWQS